MNRKHRQKYMQGRHVLRGLGELAPQDRTYWARFLKLSWGWPDDRITGTDGAYIRPQVEDMLRAQAALFLETRGTGGWFAGRPDEYAQYVSEYGGQMPDFSVAPGTPVYQPEGAAAAVNQYHLAEQGMQTAFNSGPLSILQSLAPIGTPSPFTTGGTVNVPMPRQAIDSRGASNPNGNSHAAPGAAGFPDGSAGSYIPGAGEVVNATGAAQAVPAASPDLSKWIGPALLALTFLKG